MTDEVKPNAEHASWTFLTNHAHVLICLATEPRMRLRDVDDKVGLTERAVQRIVAELEDGKYIVREREGRRNVYRLDLSKPFRHPIEKHCAIGEIVDFVIGKNPPSQRTTQGDEVDEESELKS